MLVGQLCTDFESMFGNGSFHPQALATVLLEFLDKTIGFAARGRAANDVLLDGMRELSPMQRREPQHRRYKHPTLNFWRMNVGDVEGNKKGAVGVDAQ